MPLHVPRDSIESETHEVISEAELPARVDGEPVLPPSPLPDIITRMDPVCGTLVCVIVECLMLSNDKASDKLAIEEPAVIRIDLVRPLPGFTLTCKQVSESHCDR